MRDIRIDQWGRQRCWNCGGLNFNMQRTFRSKMLGAGALLIKPKLRCTRCGEYSDTGSGKLYDGPAARKYRGEWEMEQQRGQQQAAQQAPQQPMPPGPPTAPR